MNLIEKLDSYGNKCFYDENNFLRKKEYDSGTKFWFQNNKIHREDGPAVEYANGDKSWKFEGKCHRLDGPAVDWVNNKRWYYYGKYINCSSQEEFEKYLKLKVFW